MLGAFADRLGGDRRGGETARNAGDGGKSGPYLQQVAPRGRARLRSPFAFCASATAVGLVPALRPVDGTRIVHGETPHTRLGRNLEGAPRRLPNGNSTVPDRNRYGSRTRIVNQAQPERKG
jgi:hypothetical protein